MTTGVGRVGFVKLGGQHHLAVGYWGRYSGFGVYSRVQCDQSIFKMLKLNVDKVLGMGLKTDLWREVITAQNPERTPAFNAQLDQTTLTNDVYPRCSCYKETSKQPDNKCLQCYGTGIIPGYTKFGHKEYFFAATDPASTLAGGAELGQDNTPSRIQLANGQTTGTFTSPDYAVSNALARPFVVQTLGQLWQAGNTISTSFSVNGGGVYNDISLINSPTPTTGVIRFRMTLTRPSTTARTPRFEILRARHARLDEPFVRMLRGLPTRSRARDAYGVVDHDGNFRYWTVPLRHFDDLIDQDPDAVTPPEDNLIQQKAFVEFREGVHTGQRFDMTNFEYHDPGGIFISQGFTARRLQRDEIQSKVF